MRWWVKKLSRAFMISTRGLREIAGRPSVHENCVRVLTYHRLGNEVRDPFCVQPASFDEQIALLAREKRAVSLEQVENFVKGEISLPADACLVSIDDGMLSTLDVAVPILEKHSVPAVAFVSSALVGMNLPDLPERYLTHDEVRILSDHPLIKVGSHAHTHRSMGELPIPCMREEAETSRRLLAEYAGCEVDSFAYPFGMQMDFSAATDRVLSEAGFTIAFNSMHGVVQVGMDAISLPRVKVEGGESLAAFDAISRGAMDDWRLIDDRFWRAQRVRQEIT